VHALHDDDSDHRLEFSEMVLRRFCVKPAIPPAVNDILLPDLVGKILYTDEPQFKLNGV
jgi:hypothetical protein